MGHYRILVADDDDSLRDVLSEFLTRLGFRVVQAADGPSAMRALREEDVFLSILDFHMRGTTALDLLRTMQELRRNQQPIGPMPCIVVSAGATSEEQQAALAQGAFRFLSKPFAVEHLVQCVHDILGSFPQPGIGALPMPHHLLFPFPPRRRADDRSH